MCCVQYYELLLAEARIASRETISIGYLYQICLVRIVVIVTNVHINMQIDWNSENGSM
jgi:hypothetical protein